MNPKWSGGLLNPISMEMSRLAERFSLVAR
jgi:hypothetical protein